MSTSVTVHVGPYAELLVPEDQPADGDLLDRAIDVGLNHNLEQKEKVVIGGVTFERACYAPHFSEHSPPEFKPPRLKVEAAPGRQETETKCRCKKCGHEWKVRTPATGDARA